MGSSVIHRSSSMRGKTVLLTGATAGIGRAATFALAAKGARLALVNRNPAKADALVAALRAAVPDVDVVTFVCDLSVRASVAEAIPTITAGLDRIDVLVDNAGLYSGSDRTTVDGVDEMLAANYFGPFALTHGLLGLVRAAAPSRIVVVGSEAHRFTGGFDPETFDDMGHYSGGLAGQVAYGRTKLLDMLMAQELARRLAGSSVTVNSLCPGAVATDLVGGGVADSVIGLLAKTPLVNTPEQGAKMTVRLASDPGLDGVTGGFFSTTPGAGLVPTWGPRRDPSVAVRVYERTCELLGIDPLPVPADAEAGAA